MTRSPDAGRVRPAFVLRTRGGGLVTAACRLPDHPGGQRRGRSKATRHHWSARMTKRVRAKHKIDRRLGENIWGRPKSPLNKRESRPGQHGERRQAKLSDYGQQLRAKQKLKGYYANIKIGRAHV